jgi:hypothetical protein
MSRLVQLSQNDEACLVLVVEPALTDEVDAPFLEDPLDFVSYDIAVALRGCRRRWRARHRPPLLAKLVGEIKLYRALEGRVDEAERSRRVSEQMRDETL